jgi:23S rRNA G2069 N7-methylase RlmK/C1962 C5-methylase RlmI
MREKILEEIKRLAKANGGLAPGLKTFENGTDIRIHLWRGKYWSKWSDAVTEAGLKPLEKSKKIERSFIFSKLAEIVRLYKRKPTRAEIEMYRQVDSSLPWYPTLLEHFGSKIEMVAALRDWAMMTEGYDDIVVMLPESQTSEKKTSSATAEGYVYLIKSGAFFKIGGDEIEKRVKQIRTALPDSSTLEHSIRTDDPPGIEAYWHRRFAEKRANGEWFKLTNADVAAFRKRKYQ